MGGQCAGAGHRSQGNMQGLCPARPSSQLFPAWICSAKQQKKRAGWVWYGGRTRVCESRDLVVFPSLALMSCVVKASHFTETTWGSQFPHF